MEEVGNEWRCPKCVEETNRAKEDAQQAELQKKLKEREEIAKDAQEKKQKATPKKALKRSSSSKALDGQKDDKVGSRTDSPLQCLPGTVQGEGMT